jgi:UDP-N-acetylmuramate: L-alanyl-gamma-D-glutamyl-meso-diaminopimelate ligase
MQKIHLMGICGMGMGSLAGMLKQAGYDVRGSDQHVYPPMSTQLAALEIPCFQGFRAANLDWQPDLVVVGNVITRDNPEATALRERGLPYTSFPTTVADFFIRDRHAIVVSGTHGKTTTSGIIAWTLRQADRAPGFMVGGILNNLGTNYDLGDGDYCVVEGDEYDTAYFDKVPKFVHYRPRTGILTSLEFDHADIYEDLARIKREFRKFIALIPDDGLLAACADDPNVRELLQEAACPLATYGYAPDADWRITQTARAGEQIAFTVVQHGREFATLHTPLIGRHNLLNLLGATVALQQVGLSAADIDAGFRTFQGIKRRQEVRGIVRGIVVIDDFAHHPTAVRETIAAVREHYWSDAQPGGRLWSVFEPRTATTRRDIFQQEYAQAFDATDAAIIADVDKPEKAPEGHRFSAEQLAQDLRAQGIDARHISGVDAIVSHVAAQANPGDVVVIMSNGGFGGIHEKLFTALRCS